MEFKKGQKVQSKSGIQRYRIEAGPYPLCGGQFYVVEKLNGSRVGEYTTAMDDVLFPISPQVGDVGDFQVVSGQRSQYGPYTLVYLDDDVALLKDRDGDYITLRGPACAELLATWEPRS